MKIKIIRITFLLGALIIGNQSVHCQLLERVKNRVKEITEDKIVYKTEKAADKTFDKAEEVVEKGKTQKVAEEEADKMNLAPEKEEADTKGTIVASQKPEIPNTLQNFKNYDFVPGDKIIYFYDMAGEADAEIPGRMLIDEGNAEIQTYNGEKVLYIPGDSRVYFNPLMEEKSYLPEQFTLEFDVLSNGGVGTSTDASEITLYFRGKDETVGAYGGATAPVRISFSGLSGDAHYEFGVFKNDDWSGGGSKRFAPEAVNTTQNNWRRVAVYVNKNIGKLYVDQHRIGISNQIEPGAPAQLDIEVTSPEHPVMFKNFRIAAGGSDSYNKVITEGKFIAYGIQFDVNKATLKPESMGTINEFVKMMKENQDLKFEVGGHTDSDGTTQQNDLLSQERADAVKSVMVNSGIHADRLTTKGYGSSQPIAENNNPENKARNRRVEFRKL
ncbi:MAG: OmpA family protein [Dysgonamonadaceae bacterium]|jgi:outer membrane protein OmpA-like peptidoglycan-associated protein